MSSPSRVASLVERLPFELSDTDAVNEAFVCWMRDGDSDAKRNVDLWTYCYLWKYFLKKKARDSINQAADVDDLIARTYQKIEQKRTEIDDARRYASWVSVVSKNTFLNYARRDRITESIDDEDAPDIAADAEQKEPVSVRETLLSAIERLPDYLQETARLYFLERRTFQEIGEVIGKSVATVRTYKYKAVKRLRDDEELRAHLESST